jgi:hypothetical protein
VQCKMLWQHAQEVTFLLGGEKEKSEACESSKIRLILMPVSSMLLTNIQEVSLFWWGAHIYDHKKC